VIANFNVTTLQEKENAENMWNSFAKWFDD
jgi:hypothetical protein